MKKVASHHEDQGQSQRGPRAAVTHPLPALDPGVPTPLDASSSGHVSCAPAEKHRGGERASPSPKGEEEERRKGKQWGYHERNWGRKVENRDFPGGLAIKPLHFQGKGHRFNPW